MKPFLNGPPKMGNHALWKACELLGIETDGVHHVPFVPVPAGGPQHLFIRRDPRNALLSWVRFIGLPVTQGTVIARMSEYLDQLPAYEGWLKEPGALVVTFERLIADDTQMRAIAERCGAPYFDDAWPNLPNHTKTWTGDLSDYRKVWSADVAKAWAARGGPALLARWGY